MPRVKRSEIFSKDEVQAFHCSNRCVRRTRLCGKDRRSGKDFSYRKDWIRDRMEVLAGIFGIDVLSFAVMDNHMHVVLRTRPDVVKLWSDENVAMHWWRLYPERKKTDGSPEDPTDLELNQILGDVAVLEERRERLSNVSWFMKCLSEPIARRSNAEEEVTGHFWEGRFKAKPLVDETAIAACMAYVDLNPIRAGLALTPETSDYTSARERILDWIRLKDLSGLTNPAAPALAAIPVPVETLQALELTEQALDSAVEPGAASAPESASESAVESTSASANEPCCESQDVVESQSETVELTETVEVPETPSEEWEVRSGWLAPLELASTLIEDRATPSGRRASNKGCLPMSLDQYLQLLDWTGRQIRQDKVGHIPAEFAPILERLSCSAETWVDLVRNFRKRFRTEAGLSTSVLAFRSLRLSRRAAQASIS